MIRDEMRWRDQKLKSVSASVWVWLYSIVCVCVCDDVQILLTGDMCLWAKQMGKNKPNLHWQPSQVQSSQVKFKLNLPTSRKWTDLELLLLLFLPQFFNHLTISLCEQRRWYSSGNAVRGGFFFEYIWAWI